MKKSEEISHKLTRGVNMEFANFVVGFMQIYIFVLVISLIFSFVFKNRRDLISLIENLIVLIMTNYFVITQKDYIFDNFPKYYNLVLILLLLIYLVFFRDLYSFIKAKKSGNISVK